jgi:hypothetical protein
VFFFLNDHVSAQKVSRRNASSRKTTLTLQVQTLTPPTYKTDDTVFIIKHCTKMVPDGTGHVAQNASVMPPNWRNRWGGGGDNYDVGL